jgi:hypothetical protein
MLADTFLIAGITVAGVVALALAIPALISVFRNPELSSAARAAWVIIIALFPIVGAVVYFGVRSDW